MNAGELRDRVRIVRKRRTQLPSGQEDPNAWDVVAEVWAKVRPRTGRESYANDQRFAEVDTSFWIRDRKDRPTTLDRVEFKGRTYDIVEVIDRTADAVLRILATARSE